MFTLTIETANAAFEDPTELPRILRDVSERVEGGVTEGVCHDYNGNTVGAFKVTE